MEFSRPRGVLDPVDKYGMMPGGIEPVLATMQTGPHLAYTVAGPALNDSRRPATEYANRKTRRAHTTLAAGTRFRKAGVTGAPAPLDPGSAGTQRNPDQRYSSGYRHGVRPAVRNRAENLFPGCRFRAGALGAGDVSRI